MKKFFSLVVVFALLSAVGCASKKSYNRTSDKEDFERFLQRYVFAACSDYTQPYATYSLARLHKKISADEQLYKVTFENGPCKGNTVVTPYVITKTEHMTTGDVPLGTVVLRNYWNPREPFNREKLDHWNIGVVSSTSRINQGIIDLSFPRDKQDFNPAREGIFLHNVRYIKAPEIKDVRTFIR